MRTVVLFFVAVTAWSQIGGRESILRWPESDRGVSMFTFPIAPDDYLAWTSPFGFRISPTLRVELNHDGIDVRAVPQAQVVAAADGIVHEFWPPPGTPRYVDGKFAGYFKGHPLYGGYVVLSHGLEIMTAYAHLSAIFVAGWERVKRGQPIGRVGSTGKATGPHLHFELRILGRAVNPLLYMRLPRDEE